LIELLTVMMIVGLLIAFMVPRMVSRITTQARVAATRQRMDELKKALVGDPNLVVDGEMVSVGYRGDVGAWPPSAPGDNLGLIYLWRQPPGVPSYNPYTRHGWNGPYVRADSTLEFEDDAWENPYRFIRDSNNNPIGLESAGPDGILDPPPPEATADNLRVLW
jgi:hypothetical protein